MFDTLTERLNKVIKTLRGQGRLTENNIAETLREVRNALLEADVALPAVTAFIEEVKQKALGEKVQESLSPGQSLIKIVHACLTQMLGETAVPLSFKTEPPAVIMVAGLQGSGKTTTCAKLARLLKTDERKKVMLASVDVYRPAAIEQLNRLATEIDVLSYVAPMGTSPLVIAKEALLSAKKQFCDVLILDTAGRLHIDLEMMDELKHLHDAVTPIETLFVVDSMTGQDAAHTAQAFHALLPLSGVILTKTDGDSRGGAALSIRHTTGKPIKFLGIGEKLDAIEAFYPDRMASRILGMGDVLGFIEELEQKTKGLEKHEQLAQKIRKGKEFDFEDFRDQLVQMQAMGGLGGLMSKLPGMAKGLPQKNLMGLGEKTMVKNMAIIHSMTRKERRYPKLVQQGSRKKRIAGGSGVPIQEVNRLIRQFEQMQKMAKKMSKPGAVQKMMRGMGQFPGMLSNLF